MLQTNVREGYGITTLEVVELIEDLTSYSQSQLLKSLRSPTSKDWLAVAKCTQLRNAQIPKTMMLAKVRQYGAKVKTENLSNTLTLTLSETAQRRSSSVMSNRSTASITNKFGVASLTEPAILNDANVALVDAVHYSVVKQFPMFRLMTKESQQKLEENYFEVMDALTMTLIKDDDDLLGTVNSHIKLRRLRAVMLLCQTTKPLGDSNKDGPPLKRRKTEAADSRHAKASGGRTKKDKDLEDSNTGSDVPRPRRRDRAAARARSAERKRLGKEAQLKKTRDEEELAKAKKEKEEKEARERETQLDGLLDSDDYCLDSSSDINSEDDSEDEEATTAKDLAREQKERLKALLNAKTRDSLSARVGTAMEHCTLEEWTSAAVFFGVSINNLQNKRTIKLPAYAYILYFKELLSNNGGIFANAIGMGKTRAIVLAVLMGHCDLSNPLALQFCFFSNSPPENMGRLTKEEAMEMRIDTTNAISKALAAANKLVAPQSYTILEANTPAVHSEATKYRPAPSAARFVIVCGFGKVDKHVFRAYNTMSVTAQRTIIRKGGPYVEKRAILLPSHVTVWGRTVFNEFHNCKSEGTIMAKTRQNTALNSLAMAKQWRNMIANVKHDASEHELSHNCLCLDFLSTVQNAEQQCRDILEKEGLDELEASRRVIFNRFKMQAIASYPALATLKAAQFKTYSSRKVKRFTSNSVKDLFTNLSKDHFLVREARAITKSSPKFQNLSNLCSKRDLDRPWIIVALMAFAEAITLTEATHVVIMEPQDRQNTQDQFIELELKVLGKQDVKTTSRDKLQGGGSTVTDQRIDWHQTEPIVMSLEALC
ncbi:hypothetical protein HBH53_147110 [Parastagonospora nodorum]|nr:hypothetical protein HBH53_147110 [Parastagonospora nodorum]